MRLVRFPKNGGAEGEKWAQARTEFWSYVQY